MKIVATQNFNLISHLSIFLFYFESFGKLKKKLKTVACDFAGFPARLEFPISEHTNERAHARTNDFTTTEDVKTKKGTAVPVHAIGTVITPMIFKLDTRRVVNIMPQPICHRRNSPWYTVSGGLGRPRSPYGHFWRSGKKSLAVVGNRTSERYARSLATVPRLMLG